jgi:hypothetical protein
MNTTDLTELLGTNEHTRRAFRGVYASDQLPSSCHPLSLYVFNTAPSHDSGEHWVCVYFGQHGRAYYFDSFGNHPSVESFENFLNDHASEWYCNVKPVQDITSPYCGHHVCFFSVYICIGYSMHDIMSMYTNDLKTNDMLVKKFVHDISA